MATSANISGRPPALSARAVVNALGEGVDLVLDGGRSRLGEASSVVRVSRKGWEMLREGALSRGEIAAAIESP